MNRYNTVLVDGALPSVVHDIWVSSQAFSCVIESTAALLKSSVFESWFELLCWLAQNEVHAIVLLLMWVNISLHLELVLNRHLCSVQSRSILVKLRGCVHD